MTMLARRIRNPFSWGLTPQDQRRNKTLALIGAGIVGTAVLVTAISAAASEKEAPPVRRAITIGDATCSTWNVVDPALLRDEIRSMIRAQQAVGPVDPFDIASSYVARLGSACPSYPNKASSPMNAKLFLTVLNVVFQILLQDKLVDNATVVAWTSMAVTWAANSGVPASEYPGVP
jgi:hypothetical protein